MRLVFNASRILAPKLGELRIMRTGRCGCLAEYIHCHASKASQEHHMQWSSSVVVNRWPWSFRKSIAAMICGRVYEFASAPTTCMRILFITRLLHLA